MAFRNALALTKLHSNFGSKLLVSINKLILIEAPINNQGVIGPVERSQQTIKRRFRCIKENAKSQFDSKS